MYIARGSNTTGLRENIGGSLLTDVMGSKDLVFGRQRSTIMMLVIGAMVLA